MGPIDTSFRSYDKEFRIKYSRLMQKFPFAFMVVEKDLRLMFIGLDSHAVSSIKRSAKFSVSKAIYRFLVKNLLPVFLFKQEMYVRLPSFPILEKRLTELRQVSANDAEGNGSRSLPLQVDWFALSLVSVKLKLSLAEVRDVGIDNLDDDWWRSFNSVVAQEVSDLSQLMLRFGLKKIICQGDQTGVTRVVREAAVSAGVNYVVVAHGYIKNSHLAGYAPIYADRLYVWSLRQMDYVKKAVNEPVQARKVFYAGSPLPSQLDVSGGGVRTAELGSPICLIALSPLSTRVAERDDYISAFQPFIKRALQAGFKVMIRPHPKDAALIKYIDVFRAFEISNGELTEDILRCEFVLVSRSSVAYNAISLGKVAIQIDHLDEEEVEGAVRLNEGAFWEFLQATGSEVGREKTSGPSNSELSLLASELMKI